MRAQLFASLLLVSSLAWVAGCKSCREDDATEEAEEHEALLDEFWRVQVRVEGHGLVSGADGKIRCGSEEHAELRTCGPVLLVFKERTPPLLDGVPDAGWRLDHWESSIRERDGAVGPRKGPMPDGRYYLNGFGYHDSGQLETVTAVFRERTDAAPSPRR
jgi:hypothetical protein